MQSSLYCSAWSKYHDALRTASLVRCSPRFSLSRVLTFDSPLGGYFNTSIAVSLGRAPCFRRLTNYQLSGPSTCDKFSLPIDCEVRLE